MLLIPFWIITWKESWKGNVGRLNRVWNRLTFMLTFLPLKVVYETELDKSKNYIFCPNHFSYFDIPVLAYSPTKVQFVGMQELEKVPLFGYLFKKLHIPVNRNEVKSGVRSYMNGVQSLMQGKSLVLFPEGGIKTENPPVLAPFKDGAFRMAKETNVPIVPVTLVNNWLFMPDDGSFLMKWRPIKIVYHSPIFPEEVELEELKNTVRQKIEKGFTTETYS